MKRILMIAFGLVFGLNLNAQYDHCATMDHLNHRIQEDPSYRVALDAAETNARQWLENNRSAVGGAVLNIPVVVHIVYTDSAENLSDTQIFSQIDVLNEDFRRLNADTSLTRPEFDSLASDFEINFCMATVDPNGLPTNGITRTSSGGGQFFGFFGPTDDVKAGSSGGIDPWPSDQYLNIWVCKLLPIIAGYAQFPGEDPSTDGVVIGYEFFGTVGNLSPGYDRGRTTTHEVGHWLGLRHIWGDGDCTMDDFVDDTPGATDANSGNCLNVVNSCVDSIYDYNDMVENYMDYSTDSCMNIFTEGQKDRSWSFLNTDRLALFTSNGCGVASSRADASLYRDLFTVYPNPNHGQALLQWNGQFGQELEVQVHNAIGKLVYQTRISATQRDLRLGATNLGPGAYFIRVSSLEGQSIEKMIVY